MEERVERYQSVYYAFLSSVSEYIVDKFRAICERGLRFDVITGREYFDTFPLHVELIVSHDGGFPRTVVDEVARVVARSGDWEP